MAIIKKTKTMYTFKCICGGHYCKGKDVDALKESGQHHVDDNCEAGEYGPCSIDDVVKFEDKLYAEFKEME